MKENMEVLVGKKIFSLFSFSFMLLKYALKLKYGKNNSSQDK